MTAVHHLNIIVLGAGVAGLSTALVLARDGHRVTVLERDRSSTPADPGTAWDTWQRHGVNQFRQPHLFLPRWTREVERELPELIDHLSASGAARVNMLHLQSEAVTHGWRPGDERFDTVTARRPVMEAALARLADAEPGIAVHRGVRGRGLVTASTRRFIPHVLGVAGSEGTFRADLVVDATGRRTPVPGWIQRLGGPSPLQTREPCGIVYFSRHFRSIDGRTPTGHGAVLTHHPSFSVLTLPCDQGTYCVGLIASSRDKHLRALRHPSVWFDVANLSPVAGPWVARGEPITGVMPIAGMEDVYRSYVRDGRPVVTGIVAVGDSSAATNPSLGRGATIAFLHACALRDTLRDSAQDPLEQAELFAAATSSAVTPWVGASMWFDRHRLAEMEADMRGTDYATDDVEWQTSTALRVGAPHDPDLARASSLLGGLLAAPPKVFADPDLQQRLESHRCRPAYPSDGPTRADLLRVVANSDLDQPEFSVASVRRAR